MFDCSDPEERALGIRVATQAVQRGELVVLPTDTVYGLGADAFTATAVAALLRAKGRDRSMPVPVLVGSPHALDGVAQVEAVGLLLVEAFWPGALTVVVREQPTLAWDLGDTRGTVAVRMPLHPVAIELLRETGPMAVSSANISGHPPAATAAAARDQLGDAVDVYLEAGRSPSDVPSTIVDLTGERPRVLRVGAVPVELLREVAPDLQIIE